MNKKRLRDGRAAEQNIARLLFLPGSLLKSDIFKPVQSPSAVINFLVRCENIPALLAVSLAAPPLIGRIKRLFQPKAAAVTAAGSDTDELKVLVVCSVSASEVCLLMLRRCTVWLWLNRKGRTLTEGL